MTSHDEDFLTLLKEQEQGISEDFKDLIEGDVTVIAQDKIETKKKALDKDLAKVRQQAAVRKPEDITDSASSGFVQMVKPNRGCEIPRGMIIGEDPEADYIDLHGKTIEQAYEQVMKFIDFAKKREYRTILIIHGKGERSNPKALMKSHAAHWLKQLPDVLAFHSAPEWKGGCGAVYVILKKADKQSIINREIYKNR